MEIKFNGKTLMSLRDIDKKVIQNDIPTEIFAEDMLRRCKYWLESPVEKYVHRNRNVLREKLKQKGHLEEPINPHDLIGMYADAYPCVKGYSDISDITCSLDSDSFTLSISTRKGWRKMLEKLQEGVTDESYIAKETKYLEERMKWIISHKLERCMERLRAEWMPILASEGLSTVPVNDDELAELIFARLDYKNRSTRMAEEIPMGGK